MLKVRKKGITILPKHLREEAGIREESQVKASVMLEGGGILLRPLSDDPVGALERLPVARRKTSSVRRVRKLREKIDRQVLG